MINLKLIFITIVFFTFVLSSNAQIIVKGLKLKYVLFQTSYDIYRANVQKPDYFSENQFLLHGKKSEEYFKWLIDTYNGFSDLRKKELKQIYDKRIGWEYMELMASLEDSSNINEIIRWLIDKKEIDTSLFIVIKDFFPYYYANHFQAYLNQINDIVEKQAIELQSQLDSANFDIFMFMEKQSGCKFNAKYTAQFYYTLDVLSAASFYNQNVKISTLTVNSVNKESVLKTVFHEYSHSLFKTFTLSDKFIEISKKLEIDKDFKAMWTNNYKTSYDWRGWCEENLVNGFAAYLNYKYFGKYTWNYNYYFDNEFYEYLKNINFNPEKMLLADVCIDFMNSKVKNK